MMQFYNTPNESVTLPNGKTIWLSRSAATVAHVVAVGPDRSIDILVTKRGSSAQTEQGKFCLPCGYLDWDETGPECAIRETWEETGLNLREILTNPTNKIIYNNFDLDGVPWYVHTKADEPFQNVAMHYGLIYRRIEKDLPKLSLENNETEGEVSNAFWMSWDDLKGQTGKGNFAFNHDYRVCRFVIGYLIKTQNY